MSLTLFSGHPSFNVGDRSGNNMSSRVEPKSPLVLGPWGGDGGDPFDDGWNNSGIDKLILYYSTECLNGLEVLYGNQTLKIHGRPEGQKKEFLVTAVADQALTDIRVTVGVDKNIFTGDPNSIGVLALGFSTTSVTAYPSSVTGLYTVRPEILGFFGRASSNIDRLGAYISYVIT